MSTTLSKNIKSGYTEIIQISLYLPIIRIDEALTTDPTLSKRSVQNKIIKDVTYLKTHVISGTIAESMLNHMEKWIQSNQGKACIKKYWKKTAHELRTIGIDEKLAKRKIKRTMLSEIADDMKSRYQKKRKIAAYYNNNKK
ncbi:hypothetical protein INT45_008622 [Circinella minor]|uniref:Uncharacterized protein n=1 Tax=Circinella minor TaxID=1195481 RepID=A0A8H7S3Y4_9FUNG|nr:hypothetical protein INT45_008622 [Circinella minor]